MCRGGGNDETVRCSAFRGIDFGNVALQEIRTLELRVLNPNPVPIQIFSIETDLNCVKIMLEVIRSELGQALLEKKAVPTKKNRQKKPLAVLNSNSEAVFKFVLTAQDYEDISDSVRFSTSSENFSIPLTISVLKGSVTFFP
jgi:hypothetical protein